MYATDVRETDVRPKHRLMPRLLGAGIITRKTVHSLELQIGSAVYYTENKILLLALGCPQPRAIKLKNTKYTKNVCYRKQIARQHSDRFAITTSYTLAC